MAARSGRCVKRAAPSQRACPAGDDADLFEGLELRRSDIHLLKEDAAGLLAHPSNRGIADGARLLENFLEHEMLVTALFRHDGIPEHVLDGAVHMAPIEVGELNSVWSQNGHVPVGQEEHVAGVPEDRRNV